MQVQQRVDPFNISSHEWYCHFYKSPLPGEKKICIHAPVSGHPQEEEKVSVELAAYGDDSRKSRILMSFVKVVVSRAVHFMTVSAQKALIVNIIS